MKTPTYQTVRCPHCYGLGSIAMADAAGYWLADTEWYCNHCGKYSTTAQIQQANKSRKKGKHDGK